MTVTVLETADPIEPPLIQEDEPKPYTILNRNGKARCLLICDHASNRIPAKLGKLGLSDDDLQKHIAWDIGVGEVTRQLSDILDAPAILANYSRLVVDVNRRLDHPTAFVTSNEGHPIPGNASMATEDKTLRIREIYGPYHDMINELIEERLADNIVPAIISIHSFTPVFYKQVRPWEIGVLWVQDARLPIPTINYFSDRGYIVGDNEPYDARILRGTTINHHADSRGLANVLIEIRNDLVAEKGQCSKWAQMLGECYSGVLKDEGLYSFYDGPQIHHDKEKEFHYFDELVEKAKRGEV
jgi:predicted N-formylglutamate amidohydrolase